MASVVLFVNQKGEEVVSRSYRGDVSRSSIDAFRRKIIASKSTGQHNPVVMVEGSTFMFIKHMNLFLVAATRSSPNVVLIFEYLFQKLRILKSYIGDKFTDDTLKANFTLVYELFDETMDYGYPQNCAVDVLQLYINQGSIMDMARAGNSGTALTSQITGAIDWRRDGLRYRKNEVFIDVRETVTLLTSSNGNVLRAEIHGKVMMKTQLTGMPECKFGLNDKLIMEKEGGAYGGDKGQAGVEIDDCTFHRLVFLLQRFRFSSFLLSSPSLFHLTSNSFRAHTLKISLFFSRPFPQNNRCVRLGKFDTERTITFIPPDGEFELMRYRVTNASAQPFRLIPTITEEGKTKLLVNLKVNADFSIEKKATDVIIRIPMPPTCASARITCGRGRAKYEPGERALVWRISSFPGMSETNLIAIVDLLPATREKAWVRPPITLDFQIPMYSASGVQVRFLKVYEKSNYVTQRWVRLMSKSGEYQVRI